MDWRSAKQCLPWCPLSDFPFEASLLSGGLLRVGSDAFVFTVPYDQHLAKTPLAPYVTLLVWAPSEGAALRALESEIEKDDGVSGEPPPEMLFDPNAKTYAAIVRAAKQQYGGEFSEHASYRIATDGAFIQKSVSAGPFEYCFRSPSRVGAEAPFAIKYRGEQPPPN
jgi:hypothetical protein